jgi:hypothetical protein
MTFLHYLVLHMHALLLGFLIVVIYVGLSISGLLLLRKYYSYHRRKRHNDIAGFIFATLGVIYAVILAFIVVVTWGDYDKANDLTKNEANALASLAQDARAFPPEVSSRIKEDLTAYVNAIIRDEWRVMVYGKGSIQVEQSQERLWTTYTGYDPANETQKTFLAVSVNKLNDAGELRRQRIHTAAYGLHPILYSVLIIGSIITIAYTMLFGTENFTEQLVMTSCLAAMIALTLFTVIILDYPFSGSYGITPNNFQFLLTKLAGS